MASRSPTAAAVALPAAFTAYLYLLGFRAPLSRYAFDVFSPVPLVLFFGVLAALGALAAAGWRRGLRVPALCVAFLPVLPWLFRDPPVRFAYVTALNVPVLFLFLGAALLGGVEFAARFPDRTRDVLPRPVFVRAAAVGVGHAALVLLVRQGLFGFGLDLASPLSLLLVAFTLVGLVLLGGVPVVLFLRARLVTPGLVVVGAFVASLWLTVTYLRDLAASGAAMAATLTPFSLYAFGWFVPLSAALLVGGGEYLVRRVLRPNRPKKSSE